MATLKLTATARVIVGMWLGLWTIAGVSTLASGLFILAVQLYGFFFLGFWAHLTPAGILEGFAIPYPAFGRAIAQKAMDCVLSLPLAGVFIWCGFHIAAMAWIARKNLERKVSDVRLVICPSAERFTALGVSSLEVRPEQ